MCEIFNLFKELKKKQYITNIYICNEKNKETIKFDMVDEYKNYDDFRQFVLKFKKMYYDTPTNSEKCYVIREIPGE